MGPFFTPPPGCMMEPKPEKIEEDENDQEDDEEEEEDEEEVQDDDIADSDTDTVETKDTVDSLFENVKFPEDHEVVTEKKPAPKVNLSDFVKQDLRKIISSVEYFDEEKFEGGKKIQKKKSVKQEERLEKTEKKETEEAEEPSVKDNKRNNVGMKGNAEKKVKTASGTFKVSKS